MSEGTAERRRFHRIATDKVVVADAADGQHTGLVLDVSLRGLLFVVNDGWRPEPGTDIVAHVALDEQSTIDMNGQIAHVEGDHIGLNCTRVDLEDASKLRRMVELNLADNTLLERELAELVGTSFD